MNKATDKPALTYKDAGVDIDAGNRLVDAIGERVKRTHRPEVMGGIGGFGGLFALDLARFSEPVLVSGTDGVGTKLMLARTTGAHAGIGIDLVAMCVNDIVVSGAEPLFFLDYFATGALDEQMAASVISGIADGCEQAGCALIGGETAEMPGMYQPGDYDLAGFAVGAVNRSDLLDGSRVSAGDVILGLASSGAHSNGYSLIRAIVDQTPGALDTTLNGQSMADWLMTPTRIYVKSLLALTAAIKVHGLAHITGGGLTENVPRVLPAGLAATLQRDAWPMHPGFAWLQHGGNIAQDELLRTFNCGIGMVVIVAPEDVELATATLTAAGEAVFELGQVSAGDGVIWQ
ncbi:MAG: phosphoribosylformylglycinamidine cyclo-ligase [Pseudomonadota bacterium]